MYHLRPYPIPIPYTLVPLTPVAMRSLQENRPYPTVNTTKFKESSDAYQTLINDSKTLSDQFSDSEQLRHQIMQAAQKSKREEVIQLIQNTGITHPFKVTYTPDQIRVTLMDVEDNPTCKLIIALRW